MGSDIGGDEHQELELQELHGTTFLQAAASRAAAGNAAADASAAAEAQEPAAAPGSHVEAVREVYEYQRWYGVTWMPPMALLDQPGWTVAATGKGVALDTAPPDDPGAWEAIADASTDAEGWHYATVFGHLDYKRPGGRASQRFGDLVRRRLWRRRRGKPDAEGLVADDHTLAASAAGRGGASVVVAAADRVAAEAEAQRKAAKHFLSMLLDLLARRSLFQLVPWDPTALVVLFRKHQEVLRELQGAAAAWRMFGPDAEPPPSPLVRPPGAASRHNLLQDMQCAAQHSRAAYGFAMAAGHFDSIRSYVLLQTVQPLQFDAVGGVSREANNEAVCQLAGLLDPGDILMAEWRNAPCRPCHYVAIDRRASQGANELVVLSIRGSLQVGDLLSDLSAAPFDFDFRGVAGHVHPGMLSSATYVHCNTRAALEEAARRCPGFPLLVTGHSLGGGVAALLALLLAEGGLPPGMGPLHAITMGTAAVTSEGLAAACEDLVTSVVLGADVIPHLSQASVEALLLEANAASPVQRKACAVVAELGAELKRKVAGALGVAAPPGQPLREASMRQLAHSASSKGLAAALTMLTNAIAPPAAAGQGAAAADSGVRSIELIVEPAPGPEAATPPPRHPHPVPVLREETPEPEPEPAAQAQPPAAAEAGILAAATAALAEQQAQQPAAEGVLELMPGADAAGLEGFFGDLGPLSPTAAAAQQQQQQQQQQLEERWEEQQQREEQYRAQRQREAQAPWQGAGSDASMRRSSSLFFSVHADVDTPALATALAAQEEGAAAEAGGSGGGDPELLLPPGRIVWLFRSEPPTQQQEQEHQQNSGSSASGAPCMSAAPPAASSGGEVDVAAAVEAVEQRGSTASAAVAAADGQAGGVQAEVIAAQAARHTFSRILLHPAMMSDHVPVVYIDALAQL